MLDRQTVNTGEANYRGPLIGVSLKSCVEEANKKQIGWGQKVAVAVAAIAMEVAMVVEVAVEVAAAVPMAVAVSTE